MLSRFTKQQANFFKRQVFESKNFGVFYFLLVPNLRRSSPVIPSYKYTILDLYTGPTFGFLKPFSVLSSKNLL